MNQRDIVMEYRINNRETNNFIFKTSGFFYDFRLERLTDDPHNNIVLPSQIRSQIRVTSVLSAIEHRALSTRIPIDFLTDFRAASVPRTGSSRGPRVRGMLFQHYSYYYFQWGRGGEGLEIPISRLMNAGKLIRFEITIMKTSGNMTDVVTAHAAAAAAADGVRTVRRV